MSEYIDILNTDGEKTGESQSYEEIHKKGYIHRTVHVWLINSKKQLLLQKRSTSKRAHPGMWDVSVGGHISAGQTSLEAAKRETKEELGIDLPYEAFDKLFTIRQPKIQHKIDFIDEEFNDVYLVNSDNEFTNFSLHKSEVDEVRWIGLDEFKKWVMGNGEPLVPHPEEYRLLIGKLLYGTLFSNTNFFLSPDL